MNTLIYLSGTSCISACPSGTTSVSFTCTTCSSPCLECQTSASTCVKCTGVKKLYSNTCVDSCPTGTYLTSGTYNSETIDVCSACSSSCYTCGTSSSNCLSCDPDLELVLHDNECLTNCPSGYEKDSSGSACQAASTTTTTTTIIQGDTTDFSLVYFPFLIVGLILVLVAFGGKMKDERSLVITNILVLLAFEELIAYGVQVFHAWRNDETLVLLVTAAAIGCLVIANIVFAVLFCVSVGRDAAFREWARHYKKTKRCV